MVAEMVAGHHIPRICSAKAREDYSTRIRHHLIELLCVSPRTAVQRAQHLGFLQQI